MRSGKAGLLMPRRSVGIWILVTIELVVAVTVFVIVTTPVWQVRLRGRTDDFRGDYRAIFASGSLKDLYQACLMPNVAEYWGAFWPEHLVAALCVWAVWWRYIRREREGHPAYTQVPCPHCGYNVVGQIRAGIGRCSECGSFLNTEGDPRPPPSLGLRRPGKGEARTVASSAPRIGGCP